MVSEILSKGVNVNQCDVSDAIIPLYQAILYANRDVIFQLRSFGAAPKSKILGGERPAIELACDLMKWGIANLLLMKNKFSCIH